MQFNFDDSFYRMDKDKINNEHLHEILERARTYLTDKEEIPTQEILLWFYPLDIASADNNMVQLVAPSEFQKVIVLKNYMPQIERAFSVVIGNKLNVIIDVKKGG